MDSPFLGRNTDWAAVTSRPVSHLFLLASRSRSIKQRLERALVGLLVLRI